ncbi:MAG TPA: cytochrome c biogenesis protein CcdA [Candidatus Acidoferrales bacterium]|nr:cytochrome c biogenesis protein CcdA [Candidatus Acidoferrales bacterium]
MRQQDIIFLNSVFFVIGFVVVFSVVGIALQSLLSHTAHTVMAVLRIAGGVIIVALGALLIASLKYPIPFFSTEHKIHVRRFSNSFFTSLMFGVAFAIGWTPCVGAILGAIYALAATSPGIGFLLLLTFSIGLGIPFLIVGAFTSKLSGFLHKIGGFLRYFNIIGGLFLIGIGLMVAFNYIGIISVFFLGTSGMALSNQLNFIIALVAGMLTFLSPCILPLLPAYFSYMAGTTAETVKK